MITQLTVSTADARMRAKWADVKSTLLLTEEELSQRLDKRVPHAGVRSRRLMRHVAKTLRELIQLSRVFDKLDREQRKNASIKSDSCVD